MIWKKLETMSYVYSKFEISDFAGKEAKRRYKNLGYVPNNVLLIKHMGKSCWMGMTQKDCIRDCDKNCKDSGYCHGKGFILDVHN